MLSSILQNMPSPTLRTYQVIRKLTKEYLLTPKMPFALAKTLAQPLLLLQSCVSTCVVCGKKDMIYICTGSRATWVYQEMNGHTD